MKEKVKPKTKLEILITRVNNNQFYKVHQSEQLKLSIQIIG